MTSQAPCEIRAGVVGSTNWLCCIEALRMEGGSPWVTCPHLPIGGSEDATGVKAKFMLPLPWAFCRLATASSALALFFHEAMEISRLSIPVWMVPGIPPVWRDATGGSLVSGHCFLFRNCLRLFFSFLLCRVWIPSFATLMHGLLWNFWI